MSKQTNMTTDEMLQDVIEKISKEAYQRGRLDGGRSVIEILEKGTLIVTKRGVLGLVKRKEVE